MQLTCSKNNDSVSQNNNNRVPANPRCLAH
uniref:Uncharacterized protein n=1 Tax=Anguilla anguilla TaxID=7936 RepID=A0A0E9R6D9_ANGAN